MGKTLTLRRLLSQRNDDQAISWNLSEAFEGLGTAGLGSIDMSIDKIIAAQKAGYEILMPDENERGRICVSVTVRDAINDALQQ
jgi:hypothetical protein